MFEENTIFLQAFKVFCISFQNPLFLMLAFPFVGFVCLCFLFYLLLLLFDKSSCYVLVFVFVVLGLMVWLCVVCCVFFGWLLVWDSFFWRV